MVIVVASTGQILHLSVTHNAHFNLSIITEISSSCNHCDTVKELFFNNFYNVSSLFINTRQTARIASQASFLKLMLGTLSIADAANTSLMMQ